MLRLHPEPTAKCMPGAQHVVAFGTLSYANDRRLACVSRCVGEDGNQISVPSLGVSSTVSLAIITFMQLGGAVPDLHGRDDAANGPAAAHRVHVRRVAER